MLIAIFILIFVLIMLLFRIMILEAERQYWKDEARYANTMKDLLLESINADLDSITKPLYDDEHNK